MPNSYTATYTLDYERCNALNDWRLSAMLNAFSSTSIAHDRATRKKTSPFLWVITQNDITIHRLPKNGEEVQVTTTAWGNNAFFCFRSYRVEDASGKEIIHAETVYALIDKKKRQLIRIPEEVVEQYDSHRVRRGAPIPKLPKTLDHVDLMDTLTIQFSDLDTNGHTSNAVYLDWVMNALGRDWHQYYFAEHITIKYEKELLYQQRVDQQIAILERTDDVATTCHIIQVEGERHAIIQVTWHKRS